MLKLVPVVVLLMLLMLLVSLIPKIPSMSGFWPVSSKPGQVARQPLEIPPDTPPTPLLPQPPEVPQATVIRVTGSGYELNGTPITLPDLKQHLLADRDRLKQSAEPVRLTFNKKDVRMVPLKEVRDLVNELDLDPVEQEQ